MKKLVIVLILGISCFYAGSQIAFEVDLQKSGAEIQPDMYGVFLRTSILEPMAVFMPNSLKTGLSNLISLLLAGLHLEMYPSNPKIHVSNEIRIMCK